MGSEEQDEGQNGLHHRSGRLMTVIEGFGYGILHVQLLTTEEEDFLHGERIWIFSEGATATESKNRQHLTTLINNGRQRHQKLLSEAKAKAKKLYSSVHSPSFYHLCTKKL